MKDKDENGNVVDADAILYDTKDCMVKGIKDKVVIMQGLEGYLVADCEDVLLICKKDLEKKFREFVNDVKVQKGDKYL